MVLDGEIVKKPRAVMGRPTKLTSETIDKAWKYIESMRDISLGQLLPTVEGLALAIGVRRETLHVWAKDNDDFSNIMGNLLELQAEKLMQNALLGRYNPTIAKLLLSKHGYVEKTEVDNKVEMVQPIVGGLAKAQIESGDDALYPDDDDQETSSAS